MKLFYSVISQQGQPQDDPLLSLGGFCSSTLVSSGKIGSLFGTISELAIENNNSQYVCLILKNTFSYKVSGATLWVETPENSQGAFRVAIVDSYNGEFEATINSFSKPLYAEFNPVNGSEDSILLPDMDPDKEYGLWLERSINLSSEEISKRNDFDYLLAQLSEELPTIETVNLKIEWTPPIL